MDAKTDRTVIDQFKDWSGGNLPESQEEVFVFVEYARDPATDAAEVALLLYDRMDAQLKAEGQFSEREGALDIVRQGKSPSH